MAAAVAMVAVAAAAALESVAVAALVAALDLPLAAAVAGREIVAVAVDCSVVQTAGAMVAMVVLSQSGFRPPSSRRDSMSSETLQTGVRPPRG